MTYNHLNKVNIFNLSTRDISLDKIDDAYAQLFELESYEGVKPYIEVYLIKLKKDIPLSIAMHRASRILDSSKYQTTLSSKIDGFNVYITCFENIPQDYLSWMVCKCFKHIHILLNKEQYDFILNNKDELARKRVKPEKERGVSERSWKKVFNDTLSIELITSQFAKDVTGNYYNLQWKKEKLSALYPEQEYNAALVRSKEGQNLMKALDLYELQLVENYKRIYFKNYYKAINHPDDEQWMRDKVWRLFKLGLFKDCLTTLDELIKSNPHSEEYNRLHGIALFYLKDYQGAVDVFNKAIFTDQSNPETWYAKSSCFYKLTNYNQALSSIDKAISLNQENSHYHCLKGMCHFNIKEYISALEAFNVSLKINPQQPKAWCLKAYCQLYTLDFENSLKSFDKSLTIKPNYVDAILGKAFILKKQEKYTEALEYFDKLQKIKPDDNFIFKSKRECILAINRKGNQTTPRLPGK
jgi:tetratricopeptide (TPR) repeat protein